MCILFGGKKARINPNVNTLLGSGFFESFYGCSYGSPLSMQLRAR